MPKPVGRITPPITRPGEGPPSPSAAVHLCLCLLRLCCLRTSSTSSISSSSSKRTGGTSSASSSRSGRQYKEPPTPKQLQHHRHRHLLRGDCCISLPPTHQQPRPSRPVLGFRRQTFYQRPRPRPQPRPLPPPLLLQLAGATRSRHTQTAPHLLLLPLPLLLLLQRTWTRHPPLRLATPNVLLTAMQSRRRQTTRPEWTPSPG